MTVFDFLDRNVSEHVLGRDNVQPEFVSAKLVDYTAVAAPFRHWPRFGHAADITAALSSLANHNSDAGDSQQQLMDYLAGLVNMAAVIVVLVAVWALALLLLWALASRWCGCQWDLGFWSGQAFDLYSPSSDKKLIRENTASTRHAAAASDSSRVSSNLQDEHDHGDNDVTSSQQLDQWEKRTRRIRFTVFLAGCILFLASVLGYAKGYTKVESTRQVVETSLADVRTWMNDAKSISKRLERVGQEGRELSDQLTDELAKDKLCPGDTKGWQQDQLASDIDANAELAVDMMKYMGDFISNSLQRFENALHQAHSYGNQVEHVLDETQHYEPWLGYVVFVPMAVLAAVLVLVTMMAQAQSMTACGACTTKWVLVPLLILWTLVCTLLSVSLAMGATANADMCMPNNTTSSPDATLMNVVTELPVNQTGMVAQVARYYIHQCTDQAPVDPFLFLRYYDAEIDHAGGVVRELIASIAEINVEDWSERCGRDFLPLRTSLDTMAEVLEGLHGLSSQSLQLLSCDRVVPITTHLVYDGACTESLTGLNWMASCLLVMVVMAMLMITFRAAFYNNVVLVRVPLGSDAVNNTDESSDGDDLDGRDWKGYSEQASSQQDGLRPENYSRNSQMLPPMESMAESEMYIRDEDNAGIAAEDYDYMLDQMEHDSFDADLPLYSTSAYQHDHMEHGYLNTDPPFNPASITAVVDPSVLQEKLECSYSDDNQHDDHSEHYPTPSAPMERGQDNIGFYR